MNLIREILASSILIGLFAIVFFTPVVFSQGLIKMAYGEVAGKDKILSLIPVVNIIYAEKAYRDSISITLTTTILVTVAIVVRFTVAIFLPYNGILTMLTVVIFVAAIIAAYLLNAIFVFIVINAANTTALPAKLFLSIFFPLGHYYVGKFMAKEIAYYARQENTFIDIFQCKC